MRPPGRAVGEDAAARPFGIGRRAHGRGFAAPRAWPGGPSPRKAITDRRPASAEGVPEPRRRRDGERSPISATEPRSRGRRPGRGPAEGAGGGIVAAARGSDHTARVDAMPRGPHADPPRGPRDPPRRVAGRGRHAVLDLLASGRAHPASPTDAEAGSRVGGAPARRRLRPTSIAANGSRRRIALRRQPPAPTARAPARPSSSWQRARRPVRPCRPARGAAAPAEEGIHSVNTLLGASLRASDRRAGTPMGAIVETDHRRAAVPTLRAGAQQRERQRGMPAVMVGRIDRRRPPSPPGAARSRRTTAPTCTGSAARCTAAGGTGPSPITGRAVAP